MKLDPHIHSCYSGDARSSPKSIINQARKIKLDIIAISDHDTIKGSRIASEISKKILMIFLLCLLLKLALLKAIFLVLE